jgi:magnesium-transporting ATPase (P-type)
VPEDPDLVKALDVAADDKGRATAQPARGGNNLEEDFNALSPNRGLRRSNPALGASPRSARLEGRKNQNAATKMILQASSPDEVALVKYSNSIAMELIERDRTYVQLRNTKGIYENYDIIANFPFSS